MTEAPKTPSGTMGINELRDHLKTLVSSENPYSTQFEKAVLNFLLVVLAEQQRQAQQAAKVGVKK